MIPPGSGRFADPPGPADKSGGLISVIATAATEFQYASAGPQIERLENRAAADDEVMRPGYSLLQARHVAGERQRAHASLFMIARHFLLG
jgi:hypothetical protein